MTDTGTMRDASILAIAAACHEMNRVYCQFLGDDSQLPWADAPDWQRTSAVHGVEFRLANPDAPDSASHDNWMAEKVADGWVYGEVKDPEKKTHPCIVPFDQLPKEQQLKDVLFGAVVRAMTSPENEIAVLTAERDALRTDYDQAKAALLETMASLTAMTAERDALQAALDRAAAAPTVARAAPSAKRRAVGAMKDDNPAADDLLTLIGAAEVVEVAFSDGKRELIEVAPLLVAGDVWAKVMGGLALRVPELTVQALQDDGLPLQGYALLLDGKQVAWAPRPETLILGGGRQFNLRDDVLFPAA